MDIKEIKNQLLSLSLLTSEESNVYVKRLQDDIANIEKERERVTKECEEINKLEELLNSLSEHPQKSMLIQVNPVCVLPMTLIHTSEYKIQIGPNTFTLKSLKETKEYLQRKQEIASENLEVCKGQQRELERRLDFTLSNRPSDEEMLELANMPDQVVSHKGVAIKLKTGFEILEFEREPIVTPRQKRMKSAKEDYFDVFERLDHLEEQETALQELDGS